MSGTALVPPTEVARMEQHWISSVPENGYSPPPPSLGSEAAVENSLQRRGLAKTPESQCLLKPGWVLV